VPSGRPSRGPGKGLEHAAGADTIANTDPTVIQAGARGALIPGSGKSFRTLIRAVLSPLGNRPEYVFSAQDLDRLKTRTLLIWGRDDAFGSTDSAEAAKRLNPKVEVAIVSGGHLPWLNSPSVVGQAMRTFLAPESTGGVSAAVAQ
jgi:pimeloyl-ACP methyl ester carboxylesterase